MKKLKILIICILIAILFPIILYAGIVIANNCIADSIEKDLTSVELPENTELIDSISIAGKISGNGNGMQYFGAILVSSEMTEDELENYYKTYIDDVRVVKQESDIIFKYSSYRFKKFDANKNCYRVENWTYDDSHYVNNSIFSELLDCDIRAH